MFAVFSFVGAKMQSLARVFASRVANDGGTTESLNCINPSYLLSQASFLQIPSGVKATVAYSELPTNGNGDLTWSRNSVANRTLANGTISQVAANVPRLSYMYGSCPALLLEPQRTNLALYSEQFDDTTTWTTIIGGTGVAPTRVANSVISPSGSQNAETITFNRGSGNTTSDQSSIQQTINITSTGNYVLTCYVKATNSGDIGKQIFIRCGTAGGLITVTLSSTWQRVQTITNIATSGNNVFQIGNRGTFTADNSVSVDLWGGQVEAGAYATTYIPTTTASATRLADSFTRNNIYTNGLISASGGTWYVELKNNVAYVRDASIVSYSIRDNVSTTSGNNLEIRCASGSPQRLSIGKRISGVFTTLFLTTTDTVKIAIKWNGTSADVFVNGVKQVSATAFTTTLMEFLSADTGDVPKFIQAMALYPTPLSDSDCTTLTT